ncbi:MAG: hypothetical protein IKL82_05655 [Clostridia bacterium]|nr:hypothetical protein [Clostridia bacterium]
MDLPRRTIVVVIISALTFVGVILSVLFAKPVKVFNIKLELYYIVALIGAVLVLIFGGVNAGEVLNTFLENTPVNPIKILVLFICMTLLSVFLDEMGFFRYMATVTLKKSGSSQKKLFLYLYIIVSVLTVFTSNDVIVLSFTPFLCYFCKSAKINPIPYLSAEFIASNTFSMMLIIGNPTNVYLASAFGVNFLDYLMVMFFPTLLSGITAFLVLYLIFKKQLQLQISVSEENYVIKDKFLYVVALVHLIVTTVMLAVSSYVNIEMWLVSLVAVISLTTVTLIVSLIRKQKPNSLLKAFKGAPWQLIPFVISMFVLVTALHQSGITKTFSDTLSGGNEVISYGVASFLSSNVINNIPMSVLFSKIIEHGAGVGAFYASVIGSNLGAYLTPIGALAGIMWHTLLKVHGVKYGYVDFVRTGAEVSIPTLIVALITLSLFVI